MPNDVAIIPFSALPPTLRSDRLFLLNLAAESERPPEQCLFRRVDFDLANYRTHSIDEYASPDEPDFAADLALIKEMAQAYRQGGPEALPRIVVINHGTAEQPFWWVIDGMHRAWAAALASIRAIPAFEVIKG
jgi:hypothetical protein